MFPTKPPRFLWITAVVAAAHVAACQSTDALPSHALGLDAPNALGVEGVGSALRRHRTRVPPLRPCDPDIPRRYRGFAQTVEAERVRLGVPGAAVGLIEHGNLTFAHGFGVKGPDSDEPVDAETLFRIGSLTKALTATALVSAADEHEVSIAQSVQSLLPDVQLQSPSFAELTLGQLLSHQSGIVDYLVLDGPSHDSALAAYLTSSDFAAEAHFMVPPGTFYNYSNPNYALAGLALERLDGRYYREAVRDRVLAPLGMHRTYFLPSEVVADGNYALGSIPGPTEDIAVEPDAYDNAWARPAGYAFSSVLDYARFAQFLLEGNAGVLSDHSHSSLQTAQVSTAEGGPYVGYGYGLNVATAVAFGSDFYRTTVVQHNGRISGYQSVFLVVPDSGFGLVMFVNSEAGLLGESVRYAFERFADLPPAGAIPDSVLADPSRYPEYAGTYLDPYSVGTLYVSADNGTLRVMSPDADAAGVEYEPVLRPTTVDNFVATLDGAPLPLTFLPDESGEYVWLRTRGFVARRTGPASTSE